MRRAINGLTQPKPPTLKDVAAHLGVSVSTVARSLRDGHKIGPETVERVRKAAEQLGYIRNLDGVKLRTGQKMTLLAYLSFPEEEEIGDSGALGLLAGIHKRLEQTDYSVRAVPAAMGHHNIRGLMDVVRGRVADGIILDHTEPQDDRVKLLLEYDVPFVTFGRTELLSQHAYFDIDNEDAAWQGTRAMLNQGYRRIALIESDPAYTFVLQRCRGYQRALDEAGLALDPDLVLHVPPDPAEARQKVRAMVLAQRPDAFVCSNELIYLGARAGVREANPDGFHAIGFSVRTSTNIGSYLGSRMTASHYSRISAGYNLADLLLRRLQGETTATLQCTAKTELRHVNAEVPLQP